MKRQGAAFLFDSSSQSWLNGVGLAVAIGIAYFLAARLGLALRVEPGVAPFWPAAGIAVGALIALGPGARLPVAAAVVVATAAANVMIGRNAWLAIAFGLVNAAQSLFTAWLIERWFGRVFKLEDAPQVVGFLVASAVGAAMAAAGAAVAVSLVHSAASCLNVWRLWFASCLLGIVTVAPLLIALAETLRDPPTRRELIEGAIALTTLIALSAFLFSLPEGSWAAALREAVVFPLLLWVAIRCRPVFAAAAAFVVALTVIGSTTFNIVHFGEVGLPLADRMLAAQTFALTAGVSVLLVAALFADRRRSEASLKVSAERLQLALDGAELGAFSADLATGRFECDARAARFHGHELPPTTIEESRRFVHPDDLVHFDAAVAQAKRTGGVGKAEYRVMAPPDHPKAGEVRWVALEASILSNGQGTPVRLLGVTRDITHHKQSQQALAERDTQLALAGKIALVGTFTFDIGSGKMQVSPGYAALHGLPEGTVETSRADWRTRVHPDDLPRLDVCLQQAIAHRERDHYCEFRIVRSNGECRWIEARSSISYDCNGAAQRVVGANIDVTDRKQTEAVLKESEIRLADALAAGQVIAFEWDALTGQSRRSDNAPRILGDEHGGTTNSRRNDFLRRVHPDDREHFKTQIRELCPENPSYALSFRYCCSDGSQVWLEETARGEFDGTGRLLRIKGLTRDITERKQAEERLAQNERKFRELLEALPAAIYMTDAAGHVTYCNRSAVDLWGVKPKFGEDKWCDLSRFYHINGAPMAREDCPTEIALKKGRRVQNLEAILERQDGIRIPIIPYPSPLYDGGGAIVGVVNMTVDISERKKAERVLAERTLQLALAERAALVGSVAYDADAEKMQISDGYAAIHGFPNGTTEIARREWQAGVHPEDRVRLEELRSHALRKQSHEYSVDYRIVRPGGEVRWIDARIFASRPTHGSPPRVVGVNIDVTARKRAEEHQSALLAELDHRVKNVLATVSAVAAHTLDSSHTMEQFVAALDGRIRSMASTHELLSRCQWRGALLRELIRRELAPYATSDNTEISGPEVMLSAEAAQAVAMVFHELATNAAKYGALSTREGRISVRWRCPRNGHAHDPLVIEWHESRRTHRESSEQIRLWHESRCRSCPL